MEFFFGTLVNLEAPWTVILMSAIVGRTTYVLQLFSLRVALIKRNEKVDKDTQSLLWICSWI